MTPSEMSKTQLFALVKVLRGFLGQYASHMEECTFRVSGGGCSCGYTVSLREVSDAIEGKAPSFVNDRHDNGTQARDAVKRTVAVGPSGS